MLKINIKDIEIQYDDSQLSQIEHIIDIINKNYNLILSMLDSYRKISLIPTEKPDILYLSDFDEFFKKAVFSVFNDENTKKVLSDDNIMATFYIEYLVRNNGTDQHFLVQPDPDIEDEIFYALIAYKYYETTDTLDNFVEFLKKKDNLDTIFTWLKESSRFQAYNYLLGLTINFLKESGFDFLGHISNINIIMLNQTMESIRQRPNKKTAQLPSISPQEIDSLFYSFLQYINAPESWIIMYEDLKNSKRISFEPMKDSIDNSKCYIDNNVLKILISNDGTINDFCSFVHEFAHYITMQNKLGTYYFSISELPSIFFENLAAQFLQQMGYSDIIIDTVVNYRKETNISTYISLARLFRDISRFINYGPITKEDLIIYWKNQFSITSEFIEQMSKIYDVEGNPIIDSSELENLNISIKSAVDKDCDSSIDSLIRHGFLVINGYQYLLDTFLANKILKKAENDATIVSKMIEITGKLGNMNLEDILMLFELQDEFDPPETKKTY